MKLEIINVIVYNSDAVRGGQMLKVFTIPFNYIFYFYVFNSNLQKENQHLCLIQIWNHEKQEHKGEDVYSGRQEQIWDEFLKIRLDILLKPQNYNLKFFLKKKVEILHHL